MTRKPLRLGEGGISKSLGPEHLDEEIGRSSPRLTHVWEQRRFSESSIPGEGVSVETTDALARETTQSAQRACRPWREPFRENRAIWDRPLTAPIHRGADRSSS